MFILTAVHYTLDLMNSVWWFSFTVRKALAELRTETRLVSAVCKELIVWARTFLTEKKFFILYKIMYLKDGSLIARSIIEQSSFEFAMTAE